MAKRRLGDHEKKTLTVMDSSEHSDDFKRLDVHVKHNTVDPSLIHTLLIYTFANPNTHNDILCIK